MPKNHPHRDKLLAAIENPKAKADIDLLKEAHNAYEQWIQQLNDLKTIKSERVIDMVRLLNDYKDFLEVDLMLPKALIF